MVEKTWALSDDLGAATSGLTLMVLGAWFVFLLVELRRRERAPLSILVTGIVAMTFVGLTVLRPVFVSQKGSVVGSKVAVLVDQSRRLLIATDGETRRARAFEAIEKLSRHFEHARLTLLGFGEGSTKPVSAADADSKRGLSDGSDLLVALEDLQNSAGERPRAVVVVSDGRLTRPTAQTDEANLKKLLGKMGVPIHTIDVSDGSPRDASLRSVRAAGAAVAHQQLSMDIEIGCHGLECEDVPVTIREMLRSEEPAILARGKATTKDGVANLKLPIVLDRAGPRVVEVAIEAPEGDEVPENDKRLITFNVTRDRIRLLHVAGRPTYDVRALRMWLKADSSVDLVAFFILRTKEDNSMSEDSEMALIPFPVDELFTEHLPSFDAVVLQDIDAVAYQLSRHLRSIENYVRAGGGLIMVGGPSSFGGGSYAGTPLEQVLPVSLDRTAKPFELAEFVPEYTKAGRAASMLRPLRSLLSEDLPPMAGSNTLGPPRPHSIVLWQHPDRRVDSQPMPVLALGEMGDGRSIALGVDGTHELAFSEFAAQTAGRAYGALWEGLLGWLMRDPRYEAGSVELLDRCVAGEPVRMRLTPLVSGDADVRLELTRLGGRADKPVVKTAKTRDGQPIDLELEPLEEGGYTAQASIGAAPPGRLDFACERGGVAWRDSRPDPERLRRIAAATGGRAVTLAEISDLPSPPESEVSVERHTNPLLPPWVWALGATLSLGAHWVLRRRGGLL